MHEMPMHSLTMSMLVAVLVKDALFRLCLVTVSKIYHEIRVRETA